MPDHETHNRRLGRVGSGGPLRGSIEVLRSICWSRRSCGGFGSWLQWGRHARSRSVGPELPFVKSRRERWMMRREGGTEHVEVGRSTERQGPSTPNRLAARITIGKGGLDAVATGVVSDEHPGVSPSLWCMPGCRKPPGAASSAAFRVEPSFGSHTTERSPSIDCCRATLGPTHRSVERTN